MEKLYLKLLLLLFCVNIPLGSLLAQETYALFEFQGTPKVFVNDTLVKVRKGLILRSTDKISIDNDADQVLLINNQGDCLSLKRKGEFDLSQIDNYATIENSSSFPKNLLLYLIEQFLNADKKKTKIGGVYREDNIALIYPKDRALLFEKEIVFKWKSDVDSIFLLLKDIETNHISKFGLKGNYLNLYVDNQLLKSGKKYQWAISNVEYPDLDELNFSDFTLLTSKEYLMLKKEIDAFRNGMLQLGYSEDKVEKMICHDLKFCF